MNTETNYFLLRSEDQEPEGPFSVAALLSMLRRGQVSVSALVARDGDTAWIPIGQITGGSAPPPVPPEAVPRQHRSPASHLMVLSILLLLTCIVSAMAWWNVGPDLSPSAVALRHRNKAEALILEKLKAPATARFHWAAGSHTAQGTQVTYIVEVDAENSYGAMIRKRWEVSGTISAHSDSVWLERAVCREEADALEKGRFSMISAEAAVKSARDWLDLEKKIERLRGYPTAGVVDARERLAGAERQMEDAARALKELPGMMQSN